ncbi:hypothetical protein Ccrd_014997 [Cynara cardunculus var. scolymus]|uniref:Uncharacterized protein n=1 Tax=Cynara cardunculus var. scolymus TaxID=59895 RepID=A0A103YCP1_CYNCS|nr:hypothetical protein Ccrd_014997 [Cynara cardunculus var. scolymus]
MASSTLKSAALMDQMKAHFSTDAGKALTNKIGLVYQINIAPKLWVVTCQGETLEKTVISSQGPPLTNLNKRRDDGILFPKHPAVHMKAESRMPPFLSQTTTSSRGVMKVKGSLSAAQKFTPDIFPQPSKM